jgi:hypothetical protein
MASVYVGEDDVCWVVCETPSEIAGMVSDAAPDQLLELTLGNRSDWNGKALFIRAERIGAISPPRNMGEGDEEDG